MLPLLSLFRVKSQTFQYRTTMPPRFLDRQMRRDFETKSFENPSLLVAPNMGRQALLLLRSGWDGEPCDLMPGEVATASQRITIDSECVHI